MPDVACTRQLGEQLLSNNPPRPLGFALRDRVTADGLLRDLAYGLREHLGRGISHWDGAGRRAAGRRFEMFVPGVLSQRVAPALWAEAAKRYAKPFYCPNAHDPLAAMKAHAVNGRLAYIVTRFFEELRAGEQAARGRPAGDPGIVADLPRDLWDSRATAVDLAVSTVLVGTLPAFVDVTVAPPAPDPRGASRAALDRFIAAFDQAIQASGRRYTTREIAAAARQQLGTALSILEIEAALQRSSPIALCGQGRRRTMWAPSSSELAEAARTAAEKLG